MLKFLNKVKQNHKKYAMTLAELLLVFAIMGVVATMTIYSAKPLEKGLKYSYAKIYDTLGTAFYNARGTLPKYLSTQDGVPAEGMDFDWPRTSENFCKMLLEYINFKAETVVGTAGPNIGGSIPLNQTTNDFSVANCSADTISINQSAEALEADLRDHAPHFIASNGTKFWIGHTLTANTFSTIKANRSEQNASGDSSFEMKYYVVLVDLNGDMRPNRVRITDRDAGDIVAYILTENNEVIPLGRPEYDRRYLSARVVYNVNFDSSQTEASTSNTMTYYEAKRRAWASTTGANGMYVNPDNPMSIDFYNGDQNENITSLSAFYLNYDDTTIEPIAEANNLTYDEDNCGMVNLETNQTVLNPASCYVKITDYY